MSELTHEKVFIAVKDALQRNGIKLWEAPYYLETESNDDEMTVSQIFFLRILQRNLFIVSLFPSSSVWQILSARVSTLNLIIA